MRRTAGRVVPAGAVQEAFGLTGLALLALALRGVRLAFQPLASDDAYSWRMVEAPLSAVLNRVAADTHPPLYYVALYGWFTALGDSIASLRAFSLLFGLLTVFAAWVLARVFAQHFGLNVPAASAAAALLVAIHGGQVEISRFGRMYTLGGFLAVASTALLVRALAKPTGARWASYALVTGAFAATHYYAVFTLACHPLLLLDGWLRRRETAPDLTRRLVRGYLLSVLGVVLLYSPWLPTLVAQASRVQEEYWVRPLAIGDLPSMLTEWAAGLDARGAVLLAIVAAWSIAALWVAARVGAATSSLLAFAVLPWFLAGAVSWLSGRPLIVPRYLGFAQLFLMVFWGVAFAGLASRWQRLALALLVLAPVASGTAQTLARYPTTPTAELLAARWAADTARHGDLLVTDSGRAVNRLRYLLHDMGVRALPVHGVFEPNLADRIHAPALVPGDLVSPPELASWAGRRILWVGMTAPREEFPGFVVAQKRPFEGALRSRRVARVYVRQPLRGSGSEP